MYHYRDAGTHLSSPFPKFRKMLTNLVKLAARGAADEYFKLQNIYVAIKSLQATKDFDPHLPSIEEYFTTYNAAKKSSWYELLAITDPEIDISVIRKQYKILALRLHLDKKPSVAADNTFKLIQSALDILTNLEKREAYDSHFSSKKAKIASSSWSRPRPPTIDDDQQFSNKKEVTRHYCFIQIQKDQPTKKLLFVPQKFQRKSRNQRLRWF